jgi:hypothetical protein
MCGWVYNVDRSHYYRLTQWREANTKTYFPTAQLPVLQEIVWLSHAPVEKAHIYSGQRVSRRDTDEFRTKCFPTRPVHGLGEEALPGIGMGSFH